MPGKEIKENPKRHGAENIIRLQPTYEWKLLNKIAGVRNKQWEISNVS